jgi:Tfp pilus assembly protein FimT
MRQPYASTRGFTLIDVVFVCAVAMLLLTFASPVLRTAIDNQRLQVASTSLSTLLNEARRHAIRSNQLNTVTLDVAAGSIAVDGVSGAAGTVVQQRFVVLPDNVIFDGANNPAALTFDALGRPTVLPATFRLASRLSGRVRIVQVLATGRVQVN